MATSSLLKCLIIALITQLKDAKLEDRQENSIRETMKHMKVDKVTTEMLINILKKNKIFDDYEVYYLRSSKKFTYVFEVVNGVIFYFARVTLSQNEESKLCSFEERHFSGKAGTKMRYVGGAEAFDRASENFKGTNFFYCISVFKMPKFNILNDKVFANTAESGSYLSRRKGVTNRLFRIVGKLMLFFAELNFKFNTLHGNIKPSNIGVNLVSGSSETNEEYDPFISDFDLIVEKGNGIANKDQEVRYEYMFRLPEMDMNIDRSSEGDETLKDYTYSAEFVEDTYALGETIGQILKANQYSWLDSNCEIDYLQDVSNGMKGNSNKANLKDDDDDDDDDEDEDEDEDEEDEENIKNSNLAHGYIPNMKEVLHSFLVKMKECKSESMDAPDSALIREIEESLKSMNTVAPNKII